MKYERIYFDFDGTLLDTEPGVMASLQAVLKQNGVAYTPEQLSTFIGPPMYTELMRVFGMDSALAEKITLDYRAHYREKGMFENRRYPGLEAILKRLRALGCRLEVVTNKPEPFAVAMLRHEKLDGYFDAVTGAQMTDRTDRKAQRLTALLADSQSRAVMVGDRQNDIFAAQAAGIDSIYVGYGFGTPAEARACGPTIYAPDMRALAQALGAGLFVTFEGGDGAGKSTQMALLADYLAARGETPVCTREPGGCPIAEKIRALLLDVDNAEMTARTEALLYAAARAQHVQTVLEPALALGHAVLCDRYYDSSVAYQAFGRGLGVAAIQQINDFAMTGVMPARTYYLCADTKAAMARIHRTRDRIELAGDAFAQRVRQGFDAVLRQNPQRVFFIDAACTIEQISDIIKQDIDQYLI